MVHSRTAVRIPFFVISTHIKFPHDRIHATKCLQVLAFRVRPSPGIWLTGAKVYYGMPRMKTSTHEQRERIPRNCTLAKEYRK